MQQSARVTDAISQIRAQKKGIRKWASNTKHTITNPVRIFTICNALQCHII